MIATDPGTYLGPATVVRLSPGDDAAELRRPDGTTLSARFAFAVPVRPAEGDELLILAREDAAYAIGVLRSSGPVTLRCREGLTVDADGPLALRSARSLEAEAPALSLRAGRLEIAAGRLVQRLKDAYFWLSGLFQVKSRRFRAVADEGCLIRAERAHLKSTADFSIDGRTIHLG